MITKILSVFTVIKEVISLFKGAYKMWRTAKREGWIKDGKELAYRIQNAKDDEARRLLVRKLRDHRRDLG